MSVLYDETNQKHVCEWQGENPLSVITCWVSHSHCLCGGSRSNWAPWLKGRRWLRTERHQLASRRRSIMMIAWIMTKLNDFLNWSKRSSQIDDKSVWIKGCTEWSTSEKEGQQNVSKIKIDFEFLLFRKMPGSGNGSIFWALLMKKVLLSVRQNNLRKMWAKRRRGLCIHDTHSFCFWTNELATEIEVKNLAKTL